MGKGRTWRTRQKVKLDRANGANERGQLDTSPEVIDFFRWLKRRGFRNEFKLQICRYGALGRGLRTKRLIKPDQCFMAIPLKCMLLASQLRLLKPDVYGHFEQDDMCLMAFLTHEKMMLDAGTPTEWSPAIAIMPPSYEYLLFWDANTYNNNYSHNSTVPQSFVRSLYKLSYDVGQCQTDMEELIEEYNLPLQFDGAIFQWAYAALNNRAVNPNPYNGATALQDDTCIIPLFDMINHGLNFHLRLDTSPETGMQLSSSSECHFVRYDQIHFNYNCDYSNREYVLNYNFCNAHAIEAAPRVGELEPEGTLRIVPCIQDRIFLLCDELEGILLKACDLMEAPKDEFYKKRIRHRMDFLNCARDDDPSEKFIFTWPKQLIECDDIVVRFSDTITSPDISYECVHTGEEIDLAIPATHLVVPCPDLNNVIKLLSISKQHFIEFERAVNNAAAEPTEPIRVILRSQKELANYRTLTHCFYRGLLHFEFGIDRELHCDTQLINQHLARIEGSVESEPLRRVFRNELGLLYYLYLQVLRNVN